MTLNEKMLSLISIYYYVCKRYHKELKYCCERFSNNNEPEFTDQEVMTIYLYTVHIEQRSKIKQIHQFADDYLRTWFPELPSYTAFVMRLNRLSEAFRFLAQHIVTNHAPSNCRFSVSLLDSMPIITCSGKRTSKVATEITNKGYCSTKSLYYYGLKLHALAFSRKSTLPHPESFVITPASENDLNVFKMDWSSISHRIFFGDKIYNDKDWFDTFKKQHGSIMLTPIKAVKGECQHIRQRDRAYNDLFSQAVSKVRQPIEALFSWLIEKTDIQRASKVRSTKGLLVHVFGKIAAAFIGLIFNP